VLKPHRDDHRTFTVGLSVIQTTQGLASVLDEYYGNEGKDRGVAIGYDHRAFPSLQLSSESFAMAAAAVLLYNGFKVYLFERLGPTPLVPFTVRNKGCVAGIMVTASHNPAQDDGYKLYWSNACQIIPPIGNEHTLPTIVPTILITAGTITSSTTRLVTCSPCFTDSQVASAIVSHLAPAQTYDYNITTIRAHPRCVQCHEELWQSYLSQVTTSLCRHPKENSKTNLSIVFTAMHGVGHAYTSKSFAAFHLPPYHAVPSQRDPDPTFPTVRFPNPEEKGALTMSQQYAEEVGSSLILANDPDADRLAASERQVLWRCNEELDCFAPLPSPRLLVPIAGRWHLVYL